MLFRDSRFMNETPREYGTSETESNYDSENGSKILNEGYLKVPKTFKDMLDNLCSLYPNVSMEQVETDGYVHAGLFYQILQADRPPQYITRITKLKSSSINSEVSCFGATVLPALYKSYIAREIVLSVQNTCSNAAILLSSCQGSSWLGNYLKRKYNADEAPVPQISTSDNTKRRK
jgi:hypothetical protein